MFQKLFCWLPMVVLTVGCATRTPQTDQFFRSQVSIPQKHEIKAVPFVLQEAGHCGPATLTMAMNWWKQPVTIDQMVEQVFSPKAQGSFQTDMITAARRNGMLAIPVTGLEALTREVAANHPVIVFENLGLNWHPLWHYALVYGYDLPERKLILHSGKDQGLRENFKVFERSWKLADYWALVILPPGELSATANELEHVKAASALEQIGKLAEAERSYVAILERWPQSLGTLIGRGNIAYAKKNNKAAIQYLSQAIQYHPHSAAAWHNFAIVQSANRQKRAAGTSAKRALQFANEVQRMEFEKSLSDLLK